MAQTQQQTTSGGGTEIGHIALLAIGGFSGLVGFLFLPIILGPIAVVCGIVDRMKYDKTHGTILIGWGIASTVIGMILGVLAFAAMMG